MALRTFNTFIVIGVMRSGGDTKYSLFLEMGCMWLVSLPITFFAAYKGVPIYILVALTYTEEVAKFIFGVPINPATNKLLGVSYNSVGVPTCII